MAQHYVSESDNGDVRLWEEVPDGTDRELTAADLAKLTREELSPLASQYWAERLGGMTKRGAGSPFFKRS